MDRTRQKPAEGWRARSARLLELSWHLVTQDRRLMIFPAASALLSLVFGGAMIALVYGLDWGTGSRRTALAMVLASAPASFVTIACGVATSALVNDLLDGREPSPRRALGLIRRRLGVILAWTLVVWTIGAVLKLLQDRVPLGARIVAWVLELGFGIATMFVIPILAAEGLGPRAAARESVHLLRERFGSLLAGSAVLGAGSVVTLVPFFVLLAGAIALPGPLGLVALAIPLAYLIAVTAFMTSLDYAFRTVLYRDAKGLPTDRAGFSADELALPLSRS